MSLSKEEVNGIARVIVTQCDAELAKKLHCAVCERLSELNATSMSGIMALLWTCISQLTKAALRDDGATLERHDAERVLAAILIGPEKADLRMVQGG